MKAGMIGLGAMGTPMARNLAKAGVLTAVYNRTEEKAHRLAQELAVCCAPSPEVLAQSVDVVFLCVSKDAVVLSLVDAICPVLKAGSIVVDMSTVGCETAQRAAVLLAEQGVGFLDAPVSGGVEGAKNGILSIMVGGEEKHLVCVEPLLAAMGDRIIHMGPAGAGQATKAVNQVMAAGINQAVTAALALGQAQGLPMAQVFDVVSGGAAGNWFLAHRGKTMLQGVYEPGFKLALHHKDLKICQGMAKAQGLSIDFLDQTLADYQQLMTEGYGDEDISALYRLKRPD